jgi:hypothetical protein
MAAAVATGKIYIGNTSAKCSEKELQAAFGKFGGITRIDVKRGFAFVVNIISTCASLHPSMRACALID